jgi:dihydroflavonol-4-reductase
MRHGVTGMRNFLNAAVTAGVKRIVYTSSTSTIGPPGNPNRLANENDCYTPGSAISPYYDVKWAMETEAMRAVVQGVQVITVLPTVVFGPGDVKPTTSAVLLTVARGYVPVYFNATTNFVDGRDVATGHIAAAKRGKPGQRYIIGGHNLTIQEMLSIAAKAAGRKPPQLGLPMWLLRIAARIGGTLSIPAIHHLQAIDHWQALDTGKTKQELALANPIPFEQTCQDTLQWFHEHGYLKSPPAQATQASGSTQ